MPKPDHADETWVGPFVYDQVDEPIDYGRANSAAAGLRDRTWEYLSTRVLRNLGRAYLELLKLEADRRDVTERTSTLPHPWPEKTS